MSPSNMKTSAARKFTGFGLGLAMLLGASAPVAMAGPRYHAPATVTVPPPAAAGALAMDLVDDRQDLVQLTQAVNAWQRASRTGDYWGEINADRRIQSLLLNEIVESERELVEARVEAAQSQVGAHHAAQSAYYYGGNAQGAAYAAQDDMQDLAQKRQDVVWTRSTYDQLLRLQPRFDQRSASAGMYKQKATLYRQLKSQALAELGETREEMYEDGVAMNMYVPPPAPPRRY